MPTRRFRSLSSIAPVVLIVCAVDAAHAADFVWIEGEAAQQHDMRRHGWYDSVTKDSLSGGEWLSHFASGEPPEARYDFDVEMSDTYAFWIRCNTVARPRLSYRLGRGEWAEVDLSRSVGSINIASDGKPDMRFIAWVNAGSVKLRKGPQTIRFRFDSKNQNHGAIDCFVFSRRPFRPRGVLKPGERSGRADEGFFAWEPDVDSFDAGALVDLRALNEDTAGQKGRVRRKGAGFVLGDGSSVRFWAANAGPGVWGLDDDAQVYLARRLAKCGVNMVRLHGSIYSSKDPTVDRGRLERLHHMVAALRDEGIYVALSFYFPLWFQMDGDRRTFMLLYFDKELQGYWKSWARALLETRNPYTKKPLGKDPAVAIVELVNEDSHFFWTFGTKNMASHRWRELKKLYGAWLVKKHGSLDAAVEAWGGARARDDGDAPGEGRMELFDAWSMTRDGVRANARRKARIEDQVRFLAENMRGFYARAKKFLRRECGYDGLVSCSNWRVADASLLDPLERWTYTAGDVMDHHGYFDHGHRGEASNWSVRPGHEFTSQSAFELRHNHPQPFVETDGYPHMISEIGWPMPNAYRAEATFFTSVWGSLQGLDGVFHFAIGGESWDEQVKKFPMSTPVTLGCFPAAAWIYRSGYVREAPVVVRDELDVDDLFALEGSEVWVRGAMDELRAAAIPAGETKTGPVSGIDPLTFWVGRVVRSFSGRSEDSFRRSMAEFIDRRAKKLRSATGEVSWDWGRGVATLDAPKAKGAAGFLGRAGKLELGGVTVEMKNDYGTVFVVALDDRPIASSRRILIQSMTIEQAYGFRATGKGNRSGRIEALGSAPWGVERFRARVTLELEGGGKPRVIACDEHGYPREREVRVSGRSARLAVTLDEASPYHVVVR